MNTQALRGKLYTTVVGSLPYELKEKLMKGKNWNSCPEIKRVAHEAIKFQREIGIDFPSDGQPFDFVKMYLEPAVGRFIDENYAIESYDVEIEHPSLELEAELEAFCRELDGVGLKIPLTGPFTLSYSLKLGGKDFLSYAYPFPETFELVTKLVKNYAKQFDSVLSGSIISIDEPTLGMPQDFFEPEIVKKSLKAIFSAIKQNYRGLHVCGEIYSTMTDLFSELNCEILNYEFPKVRRLSSFTKEKLEKNKKMFCCGLVKSGPDEYFDESGNFNPKVESLEELDSQINEAVLLYGKNNLMLSPTCGFYGWKNIPTKYLSESQKWQIIKLKLQHLVEARDSALKRATN